MAYGLPVEGEDGPFLGDDLSDAVTCDVGLSAADARNAIAQSGAEEVVVMYAERLAVGTVDGAVLDAAPDEAPLLEILRPVPSTVRPSVTVASLAEAGGGTRLVTTSDGRLMGRATVPAGDHDHGDHDHDHDHGEDSDEDAVDLEGYEVELTAVMEAVAERFGDRQPSPEELRAFLRDRLVTEGRSVDEAERFLDELTAGGATG